MKLKSNTLIALVSAGALASGSAAISINSTSFTYSQNFNSLSSTTGTGYAWANNSTISGWSLFNGAGTALASYNAGTGSSNSGNMYSFGATSASDRALGGLGSGGAYFGSPATGSVAAYIAAAFTNSTGSTLNSITMSFDGEQWRDGGAASPAAQNMVLEYGFGASFAAVSSWTAPGGNFNWSSPVFVNTGTGAAVDGNVAGLVSGRGGALTGLSWSDGGTLWLRWIDLNNAGNDHGLAIDNFSVSGVTAVPEPAAAFLGGLGILGMFRRRR